MAFSTKAPSVRAPAAQRCMPVAAVPRSLQNAAASIMIAAPLILNSAAIAEPQGPDSVPKIAQEAGKALGMEQQLEQKAGASKSEFLGLSSGSGAAEKSNQAVKATLSGADVGEFNAGLPPPGPAPSDVLGDGRDLGKDAQDTVKRTIQDLEKSAPKVDLSKTPKINVGDLGEFNAGLAPPGPSVSDVLGDGRDLGKDAQDTVKRTIQDLEKSAPKVDLSGTPKLDLPKLPSAGSVNTPDLPTGGDVKRNLFGAVEEAKVNAPDVPSGGEVKRNLLGALPNNVSTPDLPSGGDVKRNLFGAVEEAKVNAPDVPSGGEVKRNLLGAINVPSGNLLANQVDQAVNNTGNKVKSDVDTAQAISDNTIFDALNPFSGEAKKAVEAPETKVNADLANVKENSKNVPGEAKKAVDDPQGKVDADLNKASKEVAKLPQFQDKVPTPTVSDVLGDGRDLGKDAQNTVKRTAADIKSSTEDAAAKAAPKKFGLF